MATTGFWPVRGRLKDVLTYAENPDKTIEQKFLDEDLFATLKYASNSEKTDEQMYVSGINCSKHRAYEEMCTVKKRYGERGSVVAYHGYQSFREGEVTPQEAHEIGLETAKRLWGDRFQVVVTTHLNTDKLHNHFVINSTSFKDGKKYRNRIGDHKELRRVSDEICKNRGLSVLENAPFYGGDKKDYWLRQNGILSHKDMLYNDVNDALASTESLIEFQFYMECLGYRFVRGFRNEHPSVIGPNWQKSIRIDSLGKNYTTQALVDKFENNYHDVNFERFHPPAKKRRPYMHLIMEFRRQEPDVVTAVFELIITIIKLCTGENINNSYQTPLSPAMRAEIVRLDKTLQEYHFLREHNIVNTEDFSICRDNIKSQMEEYIAERQHLRNLLRRVKTPEREQELKSECMQLSKKIKPLRNDLRICDRIEERTPKLKEIAKEELQLEIGKFPTKVLENQRNHNERNYER